MKTLLTSILLFCFVFARAQNDDFNTLFRNGVNEFEKEFDKQDYKKAVGYLEKAVKLQPDNVEARYFLGYAYSRLSSKHAENMIDMGLNLTQKCSEQFEYINKLTPKYTGKTLLLDPYSKISAEWGSLANAYLYHNKKDSAIWAFQ